MAEFSVHACGPADREAQARLFRACFKKRAEAHDLVWRYDENPHGGAISFVQRTEPESENAALEKVGLEVSGYACSPRRAVPGGDEARAATIGETGDVMTHPDWRKRGLFSALDRAAMAESKRLGWPVVFGLPNRRSAHIFLELGWERVGTLRPWTFVVRADAAARAERTQEGRVRGFTTWFAARASRAGRARLAVDPAVRAEPITAFPREVEHVSRAIEPRFALMVRRDADYLDWRFLRAPSGLHRAFALRRGDAFVGYVVVQIPRADEAVGYLVDVLAADESSLDSAIETGIAALESAGASLVRATAVDGSWWSSVLARRGFGPARADNHLPVMVQVHDESHPLSAAARDPRRWYLTDGDRDDETMG